MTQTVDDQSRWARSFFTVWGGQAVSLLGSMLVQFALVWWLTEETESATVLAAATLIATLPVVFVGPVAGALVDRWNRRVVMIVADGVIALATMGLAYLFLVGVARTWHVYLILLVRAAGMVFHWPAMQASTSLMVPQRHLSRVAGMNGALEGTMNSVAPSLGALLLEAGVSIQGILALDVVTAAVAIAPLLFIAVPQPERGSSETGRVSLRRDFVAGLRYMWAWPGLRTILFMAMAINFCLIPASALMPILVAGHFDGDALELGWMQSVWGVGLVLGGVILGAWGGFERRIVTSMVGLVGMGLGLLVVGLTPGTFFGMALGAMFIAGTTTSIHGGPLFATIQATVAPEMQGRVLMLIRSTGTAMTPFSLTLAGPLADQFGASVWYVLGGGLCVVMGVGAFFVPALMQFEDQVAAQPVPVVESVTF
jgi:DHA3 family macrolide efflux protein-like MFS transporter